MIDQYSDDRTGWARFSDNMTMRYRLARSLTSLPLTVDELNGHHVSHMGGSPARRVTFVMLNPSTADAFKLDPTVKRCVGFARALGADVLEVVNVFALRSTDPAALYSLHLGCRGDDPAADRELLAACIGARWVIAGWGKHGALGRRGAHVRADLAGRGICLHHLGTNKDGSPKHPLYLKGGTQPQEWTSVTP